MIQEISTSADRQITKHVEGLHTGLLSDDEKESFRRCIEDGMAYRDYDHNSGFFLGMAKVRCNF
jgi:hypothetical protein